MNRLPFLSVFILGCISLAFSQTLHLIPYPQEVKEIGGEFLFTQSCRIKIQNDSDSIAARQLADEIETIAGSTPSIVRTGETEIVLQRNDEIASKGPESYRLSIQENKIIMSSSGQAGLFYAVQTLKQIIRGHTHENAIPCLEIVDWPDMPIRAILDDISRGPIPTMDYFKENIRRLAEMKINALTYYIENVVRLEKHPFFAPPGALSPDEIRELSAYARQYHIDLMGCFQSFGHFEKILSYPQYESLGELGSMLSPAFPESYELLADIYSELAPAFSSDYFLVLGDELWALGKGASKTMVQERGEARVFSDHINWIRDELAKYDKRIIVAGDMPLHYPEIFSLLDKDIILLPWDYSARESFSEMLEPYQRHGFDMIVTPGINCWRKIYPDFSGSQINIKHFIRDGLDAKAMGVLTTTWDDWGINFFSNNWYGLSWAADQSWHSMNDQESTFDARFSDVCYGDDSGRLAQAMTLVDELDKFGELQNMEATVFWQSLFPERGVQAKIATGNWPAIKSRATRVLEILDTIETERYQKDLEFLNYACDQLIYMADVRDGLLTMAQKYRAACLHQDDRAVTRHLLSRLIRDVHFLQTRWQRLGKEFDYLWRQENHEHALRLVQEKFTIVQRDFVHVYELLQQALDRFDKGYALPAPLTVRLDIRELSDPFFQTWLLCGSFPNPKKVSGLPSHAPGNCVGFDTDYLLSMGGETRAEPKEGESIELPDGSAVTWTPHTTPLGDEIDLEGFFDQTERVVAYAYCTITAPANMTVQAGLGSNDGIKVFLNDKKVFEHHELRFAQADDDTVKLDLQKGENRLLLKIDQGRGNWGFMFRLLDQQVENQGFHYIIPQKVTSHSDQ
jgi:hypothetical protein